MTTVAATPQTTALARGPAIKRWLRLAGRYPLGTFGFFCIGFIIVVALAAPVLAPYSPTQVGTGLPLDGPSADHWLGTDQLGRDLFSRLIYGSRVSIIVGFIAVSVAAGIGVPVGLIAGYAGGWADALLMRVVDAVIAFPALILALAIVATFGTGIQVVMAAIGVALMPQYARIVRAQVLSVKGSDYVLAAKAVGAPGLRVVIRHIAPNVWAPVLVVATLGLANAVVAEASLSFLGIGVKPPQPTWGNMLLDGFGQMQRRPAMSVAPGVAIFVLVLSFNFIGDTLRDALDPRLRGLR
ncbi:MAG: ABC transporter permease [Dehalococcoidia bacterium]|nr:ABC transporter permease [Dehalococcoidia bacterium]